MLRVLSVILTICFATAFAAPTATKSSYDIYLSLFGKVGEATIVIAEQNSSYVMVVEDRATGLAAAISGNEVGRFVSRGKIVDGLYISNTFEQYQSNSSVVESNIFIFDHDAKSITRVQDKNETILQSKFNISTMSLEKIKSYKITQESTTLEYFSLHDPLSLALSIPTLLKTDHNATVEPVALAKKERKMVVHRVEPEMLEEVLDDFNSKNVNSVVGLDSYELESSDEYGVYIGYDVDGNIEEVATKELYYLVGFGRIEKSGNKVIDASALFKQR